ncbi:FAD dependent oxidoreductase [Ascobolus immersus RN42]|uniref:FAD dependent oxidoreductase n=1 Tax=Ascobolus immersus RN42 TaxID=1160509 RepID=A0A3N4J2K4_ASCIM|nr:FAD dependent oxidoreductase [Ascobolus immersus RN42]
MEDQLSALLRRLEAAPGIPVQNPTSSYWQEPPHPISNIQSPELPSSADIVIIGSGITACSIVKTLLECCRDSALDESKYPRVVVLEARSLCSGGTGRNGGHIKETPHEHWNYLRETFGVEGARDITRFRLKHLDDILKIAKKEGLECVAEARKVKTVDLHYDREFYRESVDQLKRFLVDMDGFLDPEIDAHWKALTGEEVLKEFGIDGTCGAFTYLAGALSPYALVAHLFDSFLRSYPKLHIETSTPALSITPLPSSLSSVNTPRGIIKASHIIHATNGHISQFLPGLRTKIQPVRGTMSVQVPSSQPAKFTTDDSLSFMWGKGFEYITIRTPPTDSPHKSSTPGPHWMVGGGLVHAPHEGLSEFGVTDDATISLQSKAYLLGILPSILPPPPDQPNGVTNVETLSCWSGIMGFSADALPWVGRVGERYSRRRGGAKEYVCGGYSGEGMVNAWGCGAGLARLVLHEMGIEVGMKGGWMVPWEMEATDERLERADIRNLATLF